MDNDATPVLWGHRLRASEAGWFHRPELDAPNLQVWQRPDGQLHAHDPRDGPLVVEMLDDPKPGT
jgi:hypothetical protein